MTDKEKVVKGLECCINSLFDPCPYHCQYYAECTNRVSFAPLLADSVKLLKELPDIVRCGECKHYRDGFCYNPNAYETTGGNTVPDWFCADGKRKEVQE